MAQHGPHEHAHDHEHAHEHADDHGGGHAHEHVEGHAVQGHSHAHIDTVTVRMLLALLLNLSFVVIESAFGFLSGSVALIADAGHNVGDVLGLCGACVAVYLARRPPGGRFTYGFGRSSVLAALANAVLLLLACGAIAAEAIGRIASPPPVAGNTVMGVAAVGIALNGVSAWLLHAGHHHDLNRRSAYLHMLGDAAVSAGVLITGALISVTGLAWLDPAASLLIVAVILTGTWGLLRDSVQLSLDAVPGHVNSSDVMSYLARQEGVTDVHDLHIWALSTTSVALTAHLVVPDRRAEDGLLGVLAPSLKQRFRIDHATLQIERDRCDHGCA